MAAGEDGSIGLPRTSASPGQARLAVLEELIPEAVREGRLDVTALREALGDLVTVEREPFGLRWSGRAEAVRAAQAPTSATLLPDPDASLHPGRAGHLIIEGDNLEVLKALQRSYYGKVKCIFIDPPYNTGGELIYPDNYREGLRDYLRFTGQVDEEGNRLSTATESGGRLHSRWLSMMYPRLLLGRNLLTPDGAIFVSIDDNEVAHLRLIMDELFGPENYVGAIAWKHTQQSKNDETYFSRHYNTILVYRRSDQLEGFAFPRTDEDNKNYGNPDNDPEGPWRSGDVRSPNPRPSLRYDLVTPRGNRIPPPANGWRWKPETMEAKLASGEIVFDDDETRIVRKIYLSRQAGRIPENVWTTELAGGTREANAEIKELFGGVTVFDTVKPTRLIQRFLQLATPDGEGIVLDFFAGSGSTGDAVLRQNAEDGGNRRFILVQLPEPLKEGSPAAALGLAHLAALCAERIRRAIARTGAADGFTYFRLADSNFKQWDGDIGSASTGEEIAEQLRLIADNAKPGRTSEDRLYEVLLRSGLSLTAELELVDTDGVERYVVDGGALVVCLQEKLDAAAIGVLTSESTSKLVCLDAAFAGDDQLKTNTLLTMRERGIELHTI
ncbi:MAG: DNA methyltransferase [Frankiaceae bacterium]